MHDFTAKDRHFGNLETADGDDKIEDDTKFTLSELVTKTGESFTYLYDFGDHWQHLVSLEEVITPNRRD